MIINNKLKCQCGEPAEVAKLQAKLRLRENELASQVKFYIHLGFKMCVV